MQNQESKILCKVTTGSKMFHIVTTKKVKHFHIVKIITVKTFAWSGQENKNFCIVKLLKKLVLQQKSWQTRQLFCYVLTYSHHPCHSDTAQTPRPGKNLIASQTPSSCHTEHLQNVRVSPNFVSYRTRVSVWVYLPTGVRHERVFPSGKYLPREDLPIGVSNKRKNTPRMVCLVKQQSKALFQIIVRFGSVSESLKYILHPQPAKVNQIITLFLAICGKLTFQPLFSYGIHSCL